MCPGAAKRILDLAEGEAVHRRAMEEKSLAGDVEAMRRQFSEARLGQLCALLIALAFVGAAVYVTVNGQPWAGVFFSGIGIGGIVSAFIWGRTRQPESKPLPAPKPSPKEKRKN